VDLDLVSVELADWKGIMQPGLLRRVENFDGRALEQIIDAQI